MLLIAIVSTIFAAVGVSQDLDPTGWQGKLRFHAAKFSLRPEAREKLAKVAGIISGHPGLRLDVEGHTDNVGGDSYNQQLSEQRGSSVRDYLTQQGMQQGSVTTKGFGKTQPIATNDNAAGRQQNRRVELVISGEVIGVTIGIPIASR